MAQILSDEGIQFLKSQGWRMSEYTKDALARCEECVNKEMVAFPLKQNEFDALVIFCFELENVYGNGLGAFKNSATLLHLKSGNVLKALKAWRKRCRHRDINTRRLVESKELVEQREAELSIYLSGDYRWRSK